MEKKSLSNNDWLNQTDNSTQNYHQQEYLKKKSDSNVKSLTRPKFVSPSKLILYYVYEGRKHNASFGTDSPQGLQESFGTSIWTEFDVQREISSSIHAKNECVSYSSVVNGKMFANTKRNS